MSSKQSKLNFGGIGVAFSDRNFRLYTIGGLATWIGFFVQLVAVSWYAWELTHSTAWLAIVALLDIVPNVLLTPLAGAIADRHDKYKMMGVVSLLALIQATVIAFLAWANLLTIWPFAILVLLHGIIISFMVPAMYGILPRFVKRSVLTSAIAVSSSYSQLAVFIIFLADNFYITMIAFVLLGMSVETYSTTMTALVQLTVSEGQRGRVMGTMFMFAQLASGIGTYLIGYYALNNGLVKPTLTAAGICLFVWLIYFLTRKKFIYKFKTS